MVKKRTWYFLPLIIGGLFETIGYVGRIISHNNLFALGPFIMQSILLLVAPALFAASIYIILGRIILATEGEKYSLIQQRFLTGAFVLGEPSLEYKKHLGIYANHVPNLGDILSFLVQSGGGGIQAIGTISSMHLGEKLILVGLFLQILFFGFFTIVAGFFHYSFTNNLPTTQLSFSCFRTGRGRRLTNSSTAPMTPSTTVRTHEVPWKRHMYALYTASALVMVRSIFRVVEYKQGNDGYLLRREVFLYVFDAMLMALVMALFNWVHPSEITDAHQKRKIGRSMGTADFELQGTRDRYLGNETVIEEEGQRGRA